MEMIFLPAYLLILMVNRLGKNRIMANILIILIILNVSSATLLVFPRSYGIHYFLLVTPFLIWILFPVKQPEKYAYLLIGLISFYACEFTEGFYTLTVTTDNSRIFHGLSILLLLSVSLACMHYYAYYIHEYSSQLSRLANTDSLTGLANRRQYDQSGEAIFKKMKRNQKDLGILMIDLDHFKLVNDNFGHDAGDRVLQDVGKTLKSSFRSSDLVCRYGGEEFLVLLINTSPENSFRIAEEFRRKIEELVIPDYGDIRITTSIGVSNMTPEDTSLKQIALRADKALYYAKGDGRNCVKDDQNNSIILCTI